MGRETYARVRCVGTVRAAVPVNAALELFTARGERRWVDGWKPVFPAGDEDRDMEVGTVWLNRAHGTEVIWTVADSAPTRIRYTRVIPGFWAGTVEVRCRQDDEDRDATRAEVTYDTTALSPAGQHALEAFAEDYSDFLRGWEEQIVSAIQ